MKTSILRCFQDVFETFATLKTVLTGLRWTATEAVADMLGHSSISVTGDIYGHTSDGTARAAVDEWSGVLGLS